MIDIDKLQMVADRAIEIGAEKEQLFSAEEVISVITRLRKAEKDAARYKDEIEAAGFDIGNLSSKLERADSVIFEVERVLSERQKNGSFDCDDLLSEAQYYIDNHQGIKE